MNKKRILIVEDEGLIAVDLKTRIERAGFVVTKIADTMEGALAAAESERPDLVFVDIGIKGEHDGIETAARIRKQFDIPVIFTTAHADAPTLDRAKLAEPFGYLVKPIVNIEFRTQIETALWKHAMERKLRVSEAWLSTTLRNAADAIIATDPQGSIVFMNPPAVKLTGWSWDEAKGRPLLEIFSIFDESMAQSVLTPLESFYEGHIPEPEAKVFRLKGRLEGSWTLIEARTSANVYDGRLLGAITVFRDIAGRRKSEDQLRQVEKIRALSALANGLSRDLTERLKVVRVSIDAIRAQAPQWGAEPGPEWSQDSLIATLRQADRACARAQEFATQLAVLAGSELPQVQMVDVNRMIQELSGRLQRKLGLSRHLKLSLANGLPPIKAEREGIVQAISNLVDEAREAMPAGGVVELGTDLFQPAGSREAPVVRLTVKDSGKHILPNALDQTFDPYSQRRPGMRDSGLSMTLVYHCVALNGGSVAVHSGRESGTTIEMMFPAAGMEDAAICDWPLESPTSVTSGYLKSQPL